MRAKNLLYYVFLIFVSEIFKLETSPGQQNTKLKLLKLPEKPQYDVS